MSSSFVVFLVTLLLTNGVLCEHEHDIYDQSEGLVSQEANNFKVAVIGSGIGGASATHFLRLVQNFPISFYQN